ncbi:hypothetical protein QR680_015537 [Steinernema hermaphroditum]|uniref:G-protein coupled receptors family 1 profile domain-containing protein n=1 Tax=Steinernema hermaphroditum TaxID=289476 RepID=A0AA39LKE8_9BILA|nr:hypothetical protein QR680_015537 [Steinernema hermaphroditum]
MAVALPLHILTTYLIIRKSPSNFNAYKYVLLNVSFWAFLCDMTLDVVTLPMLTAEIFAVHAEGLIKGLGPRSGVVGTAVSSFCIAEILMALLIAFFYRYTALKMDFKVFGKTPKKWHYFLCTTLLMVVLPAFVASQVIFAYISEDELKAYTQKSNRSMLSEQTYRQHVQLLKALVVQTMSPLILLTIPLFVLFGGLICGLNMMNGTLNYAKRSQTIREHKGYASSLMVYILFALLLMISLD